MLTLEEARQLVRRELDGMSIGDDLVILDDLTMERPWGWVFFYDLRSYAESVGDMDTLAGNAPYLVKKHTGELFVTGTAEEIEHYIERYEATGDPHG
jgi:hypothetical protein